MKWKMNWLCLCRRSCFSWAEEVWIPARSMQTLLDDENIGHRWPRDGAPNWALLKSITALNTMLAAKLAAKLRSTIFVREALLRPDANVIRKVIAKCNDPTVKCWIWMISGTYPVNSCLYRIKKVKSPSCTFCDRGDIETLSHFLKVCPKFHHATTMMLELQRTIEWDRPCSNCSRDTLHQTGNSLKKLPCSWVLTGLCLIEVPTALVQKAGLSVQDSQIQAGRMSLGRQPDIVGPSLVKKKIAIGPDSEVSLLSDSWLTALQGAHNRKIQSYSQLITDLQVYVDSRGKVEILLWVVGARGMVRVNLLTQAGHLSSSKFRNRNGLV